MASRMDDETISIDSNNFSILQKDNKISHTHHQTKVKSNSLFSKPVVRDGAT
jgi:hypothetical protein